MGLKALDHHTSYPEDPVKDRGSETQCSLTEAFGYDTPLGDRDLSNSRTNELI